MKTEQTAKDKIKIDLISKFKKTRELMEFIENQLDDADQTVKNKALIIGMSLVKAIEHMENEFLKLKKLADEFEEKFTEDKKNGH
jgi:vacuolar-type H+-ATPase catalytic subunit A/Vma1